MNPNILSTQITSVGSAEQITAKREVVVNTDEMRSRTRSALFQALALRCNESDDSSDETESNHSSTTAVSEEDEGSDEEYKQSISQDQYHNNVRLPSTFSLQSNAHHFDRRVSSASQRSPQVQKRISSLASKNANRNSFRNRHRPAPMELASSTHASITPSIEIEQVFDDDSEAQTQQVIGKVTNQASDARLVARTKMMQALGRNRLASLRRSESMDVLVGQTADKTSPSSNARLSPSALTPLPRTPGTAAPRSPGTAYHQRSFSCPTPQSPMLHNFGEVQVIVTPPTPRPQGSPIIGVFIKGVHNRKANTDSITGQQHFCAFDDMCMSTGKCRTETKLSVPEFELAPGRSKLIQAQRAQALAMIAWQKHQEANNPWHNAMFGNQDDESPSKEALNQVGLFAENQQSPILLPGTPGAPSLTHVQEVRAMQSRHMLKRSSAVSMTRSTQQSQPNSAATVTPVSSTNATVGDALQSAKTSSASSSSWWREPRSAPLSWNGSSASAYSQASAMSGTQPSPESSMGTMTHSAFSMVSKPGGVKSAADSSLSWRRKSVDEGESSGSDDSTCVAIKGASPNKNGSRSASSGLSKSDRPYVPPGKRNAMQSQQSGLMGRKEGVAAAEAAKKAEILRWKNETEAIRSAPAIRSLVIPSSVIESTAASHQAIARQRAASSMLSRLSHRTAPAAPATPA
ncbi:uncharacterized protein FA14DRAFT_8057 [Meira miltonrushii]|uniref:Uncharacterized protein n=1 Tax=Meira miltonrushii TaxID=1280837 RepID=A0A316VH53_9BASI|nr:uncharacterized protein FA14DRAFT_8057 [Meira miltonrushii]PWN36922.1 hypothetical protein FA14DRAFT_8057 [Meira miltonrushii]